MPGAILMCGITIGAMAKMSQRQAFLSALFRT